MLRFRLILAWLLLAALPLQGWAAATMLFCGPVQPDAVVALAHSAHATGHHDMHEAQHDTQAVHAPHHVASADAQTGIGSADHGTCGVCAACCNGVALAQTPHWPSIAVAPGAYVAEPLAVVLARPSPVPDKPPRA